MNPRPVAAAQADLLDRLRPRTSRPREIEAYLGSTRAAVETLHRGGASGHAVAAAWSDGCDRLIRALFQLLTEGEGDRTEGVAVFALGEFAQRVLAPYSALELLLLHREACDAAPLLEGLLSSLQGLRLDVQGEARTLGGVRAAAADAPRSLVALLQGRFLCGDPRLAEPPGLRDLGRDPDTFGAALAADLAEEMGERHVRCGGTVYLLEPQLVEGQGGLRDIQSVLWTARYRFGVQARDVKVPGGRDGMRALEESREFLLRLRHHLHFLCGRREDRLRFELQDEAAPFFGHPDPPAGPGAEGLLQSYYACANRVGSVAERLLRRAAAGEDPEEPPRELGPGLHLRGGEIHLDARGTAEDPLRMLAAFEAAQDHDADLSPQALDVIRGNLARVDDRFRRDPAAVALFLRVLQHPRRVATTLMRMHDVRFLDRFIPELEPTFGRIQRDPYHAFPVDVHSLFAVQELRRLARGEYREEFPQYTRVMEELQRPHLVYLAALLHDAGKGHGSRHEERGAELAIRVADRMDLPSGERACLEFLVREHLSLALTAQSRDLHDEDLIETFAARIGDPQLLRMLHLLTFADVRAVGPGSWTGWKHQLFRELYDKSLAVLERGPPRRDMTGARVEAARQRLRAAARGLAPEPEVEAFLAHIEHPRYLLAYPVEVLVRHLTAFLARGAGPVVELQAVPAEGYTEMLLLTRDRPGLFAAVAGLLAAHRINVLSAVLNTRTDGWVVDVFHVALPPGEPRDHGPRWERWREELAELLAGSGELPPLEPRRLGGPARPRGTTSPVRTSVSVDNDASARFTVVDLSGPDRLGLLYDVARALAEQGLTIRLAKITTMLRGVADAFYVETVDGGKLTHPGGLAALQSRLEAVITGADREG